MTRYCYRDREIVAQPWDLRRLNGARSGTSYVKGVSRVAFLGVVESRRRDPLPTMFHVERLLRHNRSRSMPQDSLYLTIVYEADPSSTLSIARIEPPHPIFHNVARVALSQAEKRGEETARLERLLEAVLPGFRE